MKVTIRIALSMLLILVLAVTMVAADEDGEDVVAMYTLASSSITFDDDGLVLEGVASVVPTVFFNEDGTFNLSTLITEAFEAAFGYDEDLQAHVVLETEDFQMELMVRPVPGYDMENPTLTFEFEFVSGEEFLYDEETEEFVVLEIEDPASFFGTFEGAVFVVADADFFAAFVAGVDAYYEDTRTSGVTNYCTNPRAC